MSLEHKPLPHVDNRDMFEGYVDAERRFQYVDRNRPIAKATIATNTMTMSTTTEDDEDQRNTETTKYSSPLPRGEGVGVRVRSMKGLGYGR